MKDAGRPLLDATDSFIPPLEEGNVVLEKSPPVTLEWSDIRFSVDVKKKPTTENEESSLENIQANERGAFTKHILHGISGYCKPGQLLAIMGPTGSGKTSLLNILSGRAEIQHEVSGELYMNGEVPSPGAFGSVTGYVQQSDVLFSNLTVGETLLVSALLRLPQSMTMEEKLERVKSVSMSLGLVGTENTYIGNEFFKGVSGGEKKRVAVGMELVRRISVMFLDEPTSGLDSFMAYNVMQVLSQLAREQNRAVITTIHQPRSNIFELFDNILLLSEGRVVYFGGAKEAKGYFESLGYPCPEGFNYADHFLDVISKDTRSHDQLQSSRVRIKVLADAQEERERTQMHNGRYLLAQRSEDLEDPSQSEKQVILGSGVISPSQGEMADIESALSATAPWFFQLRLLLWRAWVQKKRNKFVFIINTIQVIFFSLIIGGMYFNIGMSQESVQDRSGVLFFIVLNQGFSGMFSMLNTFSMEKGIIFREKESGYWNTSAFFIAKAIAELPLTIPFPIAFVAIVYWMIGLQSTFLNYAIMTGAVVITNMTAAAVAISISAAAPNLQVASLVAPMVIILFMLVSGLYINVASLNPVFEWIGYISFIKYAYRILMVNEFTGLVFCDYDNPNLPNPDDPSCVVETGEKQLMIFSMDDSEMWLDFVAMAVLCVCFYVMGYIFLRMSFPKRKLVTAARAKKE